MSSDLKTIATAVAFATLLQGVLSAANAPDYTTWVQMENSDTTEETGTVSSGRPRCSWTLGTYWSDGTAPTPGKNYFVPADKLIFMPNSSWSSDVAWNFPGGALAVAGTLQKQNTDGRKLQLSELHLLGDAVVDLYRTGLLTATDIYIESTREHPVVMLGNGVYDYGYLSLYGTMHGDEDAAIVLRHKDGGHNNCTYYLGSDWSDYFGRVIIANTYDKLPATDTGFLNLSGTLVAGEGYTLNLPSFTQPKGFGAEKGGVLNVTADCTVGHIAIGGGGTMRFKFENGAAKVVTVTDWLDLESGAAIEMNGWTIADITGAPKQIPLFVLTGEAAKTMPDFIGVKLPTVSGGLPSCRLVCISGDNDTKTVVLTWNREVITLAKQPDENGAWATDGSYWLNGEPPSSDYDYLLSGYSAFTAGGVMFDGNTLSLSMSLYLGKGGFTCNKIILDGISPTVYGSNTEKNFNCIVEVADKTSNSFICYQQPTISFSDSIIGEGTLRFTLADWHNQGTAGLAKLLGDNSGFGGKMVVATPVKAASGGRPATPDLGKEYFVTCVVNNSQALGGVYTATEDGYDAVTFSGYSLLRTTADVKFDEPTRGFLISDGGATFDVPEGKTMEIGTKMTYDGELRKTGAGTLALGGAARFTDGSAVSEPQAGKNILSILSGSLKPVTAEATDGLDIRFSEGTELVLDVADPNDAGLCGVREGSALSILTNDGKLPVRIENADGMTGDRLELAVCTVVAEAAESLKDKFTAKLRGFAVPEFVSRTNEDGSVTIHAVFERKGTLIILK